jgi:hypothetical protein
VGEFVSSAVSTEGTAVRGDVGDAVLDAVGSAKVGEGVGSSVEGALGLCALDVGLSVGVVVGVGASV